VKQAPLVRKHPSDTRGGGLGTRCVGLDTSYGWRSNMRHMRYYTLYYPHTRAAYGVNRKTCRNLTQVSQRHVLAM
jgi:hypothetical protein